MEIKVISMKILNFKNFIKKNNLKIDNTNESQLQKDYFCRMYSRDSGIITVKALVNIDDESMMATHWSCFIIKDNKSSCYNGFGGALDKCLLNQIPKQKTYNNFKKQGIYSKLCVSL